jgi:hypothetical protein
MAKDDYTRASAGRDKKKALVVSGNTVFREKPPTNPGTAERFTNFAFDHTEQLPIKPSTWARYGKSPDTTMNASGRSALPTVVEIGGSPDMRGKPFAKSTRVKKPYY